MLNKELKNKNIQNFIKAILSLKKKEEVESFFQDILTPKELRDISERLEIGQLLEKGMSYREIAKKLGVSTTTVTRTSRWLNKGTGGFKLVVKRLG